MQQNSFKINNRLQIFYNDKIFSTIYSIKNTTYIMYKQKTAHLRAAFGASWDG